MKAKKLLFISAILLSLLALFAVVENKPPRKQVYDDESVANLITVITTTNPIPSIPDTKHLYLSQTSIFRIPAFAKCKKIIVFDGIQKGYESRNEEYEKYKQNVIHLTKTDPLFANTKLVFCSSWVHIASAIKEALKHVTTPYLFIHQHDFVLQKDFDLNGVIASMEINPHIKHVRLSKWPTNTSNTHPKWDGPVDRVLEGKSFVPLSRTFAWSDYEHVTRKDYYLDFVLPKCGQGAMEWVLHPALKASIEKHGLDEGHKPFGTYLYGDLNDGFYIYHADGRGVWPK